MTTIPAAINPEDLPLEVLVRLSEFAGTILNDILESDKYEDILDDLMAEFSDRDIITSPNEYYEEEGRFARATWRILAMLLLDLPPRPVEQG